MFLGDVQYQQQLPSELGVQRFFYRRYGRNVNFQGNVRLNLQPHSPKLSSGLIYDQPLGRAGISYQYTQCMLKKLTLKHSIFSLKVVV